MNARFLERLINYRELNRLDFCKIIISNKIRYQFLVINKKSNLIGYEKDLFKENQLDKILLVEARAAKEYWHLFGQEMSRNNIVRWQGRKAHKGDVVNKLLDIGYHFLNNKIFSIFASLEVPPELGFFHKAQDKNSQPLVYDFMEWLRPFVVDEVLLNFVAKKKKPVEKVDSKTISYFLSRVKRKFEQKYYHRSLKYCVSLEYWITLSVLDFVKSVNQDIEYDPIFPSLRHESRCKLCKTKLLKPKLRAV